MRDWSDFFSQIRMLLESGQNELRISADDALVNIAFERPKPEHGIIISFDRTTGKLYHLAAHKEV